MNISRVNKLIRTVKIGSRCENDIEKNQNFIYRQFF